MHRSGVDGKENNEDNESEDSCEDEGVHAPPLLNVGDLDSEDYSSDEDSDDDDLNVEECNSDEEGNSDEADNDNLKVTSRSGREIKKANEAKDSIKTSSLFPHTFSSSHSIHWFYLIIHC